MSFLIQQSTISWESPTLTFYYFTNMSKYNSQQTASVRELLSSFYSSSAQSLECVVEALFQICFTKLTFYGKKNTYVNHEILTHRYLEKK